MHDNSAALFKKYALPYFQHRQKVLEVGTDWDRTYQRVLFGQGIWPEFWNGDIVGSDEMSWVSFCGELAAGCEPDIFDVVLAGQVLEHVRRPWRWVPELARITKPGGLVILINPVSWPYHEAPVDCWRIYPEGMRVLCADAGLECLLSVAESLSGEHMPGVPVLDTITIARKPLTEV